MDKHSQVDIIAEGNVTQITDIIQTENQVDNPKIMSEQDSSGADSQPQQNNIDSISPIISNSEEAKDQQGEIQELPAVDSENKVNSSSQNQNSTEGQKKSVAKNAVTAVKALMALYYMKQDAVPAEILPGFYLGSIGSAINKKVLEEHKIEHILCCCDGVKETIPTIKYKNLPLLDKATEDITRFFEESGEFIHDILTKGGKVLVHCFAGKSRSTTIMISYLIKYHGMTVEQSIELIKAKRSVIRPNLGFLMQLKEYEKKILAKLEEKREE